MEAYISSIPIEYRVTVALIVGVLGIYAALKLD